MQATNKTTYEKGMDQGRLELIYLALEKEFGKLSPAVKEAVAKLSRDEANEMFLKIGEVQFLSELGLPDAFVNAKHTSKYSSGQQHQRLPAFSFFTSQSNPVS